MQAVVEKQVGRKRKPRLGGMDQKRSRIPRQITIERRNEHVFFLGKNFRVLVAGYKPVKREIPPSITQTVLIDGYTAPGASANTNPLNLPNDASITVEIQGPGAGLNLPVYFGLVLSGPTADGSVIRGLCINNFANIDSTLNVGYGIVIESDNCTVEGCFIGTAIDGATPLINVVGIGIYSNNTVIGGATPDARNLLLGAVQVTSGDYGVILIDGAGTTITNNTIGLTAQGDVAPNTGTNFGIVGYGGALTVTNNVISGNSEANVVIYQGVTALETQNITNNLIGTNIAGTAAVPTGTGFNPNGMGVLIQQFYPAVDFGFPASTITLNNNVISGNTFGVMLGANGYFIAVYGTQITDNFIGTDLTGTLVIPNTLDGINLNSAVNSSINGNVIANNGRTGIATGKAKNTIIKSNEIVNNGNNGIQLGAVVAVGVPSFGDIVGGALAYEGNYIANNGGHGIQVVSYTQQETIQGNTITNNALDGIRLGSKSSNNWVGGFRNAGNNLLTGELQSQEYVNLGPLGTSNEIYGNGGYGISAIRSDA